MTFYIDIAKELISGDKEATDYDLEFLDGVKFGGVYAALHRLCLDHEEEADEIHNGFVEELTSGDDEWVVKGLAAYLIPALIVFATAETLISPADMAEDADFATAFDTVNDVLDRALVTVEG